VTTLLALRRALRAVRELERTIEDALRAAEAGMTEDELDAADTAWCAELDAEDHQ